MIAPEVAVTPVFHGRQRKRRLPEEKEKEDGGGDKKVKKEENDNVYRIHAKNFRKADEEQGEIKEMEQMGVEGSKQDEKEKLSKSIKRSNEVVATVGKEGPSPPSIFGQRGPKLLNGSSPASAGLIPRAHPQQSPSTAKMVPKTALKQDAEERLDSKEVIREDLRNREAAMADLKLAIAQDINGNCPIHVAVLLGNLRLVQRFAIVLNVLNRTIDVANGQGMTALHLAVANGEEAIVDELSRHGADPSQLSSTGDSAIHLAVKRGHVGCLRILLKRNPGRRKIDQS